MITFRNLIVTMFLGGLWHGAGWTFVCWGFYHGLLLSIHHTWKQLSTYVMPRFFAITITFVLVNYGWVLFRSPDFSRAKAIIISMLGFNGYESIWRMVNVSETFGDMPTIVNIMGGLRIMPVYVIALIIIWLTPNTNQMRKSFTPLNALWLFILFFGCLLSIGSHDELPFLYFDF